MAGDELACRGWNLTEQGITELVESGGKGIDRIIKTALDTDLRDIGEKWLSEELHKGKLDYVQGPAVLQLMKLRNISAPKQNEDSQAAPRLLRLSLTDGHMTCTAIEMENLKHITLGTPPGTKVLLEGAVDVENNLLLLTNKNFRCLGGRVEKIVESWELKRKLAKQVRYGVQTEGGPPLFIPFGKKMPASQQEPISQRDKKEPFKSLDANKSKEKKEDDTEFEQQRQATIAVALQDKKTKTFGGGMKQPVEEKDVARIVEMGFTTEQASTALRQTNGNIGEAIGSLLSSRGGRGAGRGDRGDRGDRSEPREPRQGGRGHRGRDRYEDEEESGSSRPSGPATLFDFLENKIPVKEETKTASASIRSTAYQDGGGPHHSNNYNSSYRGSENGDRRPASSKPPPQNPHYSNQYEHSGPPGFQNRKQNLPPRLSSRPDGPSGRQDGPPCNSYNKVPSQSYQSDNSYSDDRTSKGGNSQRRYDNQNNVNAYDRNQKDFNQLRPKSGSYESSGYGDSRDYQKENRYNNRQDGPRSRQDGPGTRQDGPGSRQDGPGSRQDGPGLKQDGPGSRQENRYGGQGGRQGQRTHDQRSQDKNYRETRSQNEGPRKPYEQPQPAPPVGEGNSWKQGDQCLAKYWEDGQFYAARIEDFAPNGATCVVTFLEYGNMEEILLSDVKPVMQQQSWQNNPRQFVKDRSGPQGYYSNPTPQPAGPMIMQPPPPFPGQDPLPGSQINSMEFRRSGNGVQYQGRQQPRQQKGRPSQNFYQPPAHHS